MTFLAMSRVVLAAKLSFIRLKWASGVTVLTFLAMGRVALVAKLSFIRLKWAPGVTVLSVPAINAAKTAALRTDVFLFAVCI